jgi:hypothetical protein
VTSSAGVFKEDEFARVYATSETAGDLDFQFTHDRDGELAGWCSQLFTVSDLYSSPTPR